jgi:erythromycin esterase-like protein
MSRTLLVIVAAIFVLGCATRENRTAGVLENAVAAAVADLCDDELVLIGEASDHGRGATLDIKAQIARQLIEECGFNALLFESGYYDFSKLYLERSSGLSASQDDLSSSIGGIWNRYGEVAALVPFLTSKVNDDALIIGGLDFNLGSAGAFYSIDAMPADLASLIVGEFADECARRVRQLIYFSYGREGPQSADVEALSRCADAMAAALDDADAASLQPAVFSRMIVNMRAYARSIVAPPSERIQARELAFFENFQWWRSRLSADSKIIVWGASVHVAKTTPGLELFREVDTFGAMVRRSFGEEARFLNFVAVSGSYRFLDREEQSIPAPQPGSVEALYSDLESDRYLDREAVRALGVRPSSIFGGTPVTADISSITDGLIVIARERPPVYLT